MRSLLIVLALAGCYRNSGPAAPSNNAAAPSYEATANDELGFLPVDADLVIGIDMANARRSALWQKLEPQLIARLGPELDRVRAECGVDPLQSLERATLAMKMLSGDRVKGVFVLRGLGSPRMIECFSKQNVREGGKSTDDRGVLVMHRPSRKDMTAAVATVGTTMVIHFDASANRDTVAAVLAGGAPLRSSPAFLSLYARREPGSTVWGMLNGSSPIFDAMGGIGARPKSVDGTLTVTDRLAIAVRMTMPSAGDADRLRMEIDKAGAMARNFVERLDTAVKGDSLQIDVVITEDQLRGLIGMMGGAIGP